MDVIKVEGGNVLRGSVQVEGAKNSALKLMAATVMAPGVYHLTRIPDISDVRLMCKVLETLGAFVMHGNHELTIDTTGVDKWVTPYEIVSKMRASISVVVFRNPYPLTIAAPPINTISAGIFRPASRRYSLASSFKYRSRSRR